MVNLEYNKEQNVTTVQEWGRRGMREAHMDHVHGESGTKSKIPMWWDHGLRRPHMDLPNYLSFPPVIHTVINSLSDHHTQNGIGVREHVKSFNILKQLNSLS